MLKDSILCIALGSIFSFLGIVSVVVLPPGINLLWSLICFLMAGVIFMANFYDVYRGGNLLSDRDKNLKVKEVASRITISSLISGVANMVLPIFGGLLASMYYGTSTCLKRDSNFILTILVSFSSSIASGLGFYWMTSCHVPSGIFSGVICFLLFWGQYFYVLRYPGTI